jgi:HAD superfamily hydrolase (TIGR01509 family)
MSIKAWMFDLGKTLMSIPDEYDEEMCLQTILEYTDVDQVRSIIYRICDKYPNQTVDDFLSRFNSVVNQSNNEPLKTALHKAWMTSVKQAKLEVGALEILDHLHEVGMKLALISNTPPTSQFILDYLQLRSRFDVIVFSCDVGYLKPDPRIFKIALQQLGVKPEEAVLVGDKIRTDILGGAILGVKTILLETRLRVIVENDQNYVNAIIPSLRSLEQTKIYKEISIQ